MPTQSHCPSTTTRRVFGGLAPFVVGASLREDPYPQVPRFCRINIAHKKQYAWKLTQAAERHAMPRGPGRQARDGTECLPPAGSSRTTVPCPERADGEPLR